VLGPFGFFSGKKIRGLIFSRRERELFSFPLSLQQQKEENGSSAYVKGSREETTFTINLPRKKREKGKDG